MPVRIYPFVVGRCSVNCAARQGELVIEDEASEAHVTGMFLPTPNYFFPSSNSVKNTQGIVLILDDNLWVTSLRHVLYLLRTLTLLEFQFLFFFWLVYLRGCF